MPASPSTSITVVTVVFVAASGNMGSRNRRKPYAPIFSSTAARMTEPGVGASTWASGNHVWNGTMGTLMANARANAVNSRSCWCTVRETRSRSW